MQNKNPNISSKVLLPINNFWNPTETADYCYITEAANTKSESTKTGREPDQVSYIDLWYHLLSNLA